MEHGIWPATGHDFIRKQLRLGYTPEDIALMLESGLGKLPDTVAGPKVTDAAYNKYANALQGLGG